MGSESYAVQHDPAPARLRRLGQLLQGPPAARPARARLRARAGGHLRRRHAHRRTSAGSTRCARRPVLEEEGADPLPESNAILLHLAEGTRATCPTIPPSARRRCAGCSGSSRRSSPRIAGLRFRLMTGRLAPDRRTPSAGARPATRSCGSWETTSDERHFMVGERYSVADISLYAYVHVAHEAGFDLAEHPAVGAWLERVESTPGFMNDFEPVSRPRLARCGQGRSIYGTGACPDRSGTARSASAWRTCPSSSTRPPSRRPSPSTRCT